MSHPVHFDSWTGVAAPLPVSNVDTDMIIPGEFCNVVERTGLAKGLFYGRAHGPDGKLRSDFVLNLPAYHGASILIGASNFGCGSSREHAPWALLEAGFRVVIAASFAEIFYSNCFRNGLLLIPLPPAPLQRLMDEAQRGDGRPLQVSLRAQQIVGTDGEIIPFTIGTGFRERLLAGFDEVATTLEHADEIARFEAHHATQQIRLP